MNKKNTILDKKVGVQSALYKFLKYNGHGDKIYFVIEAYLKYVGITMIGLSGDKVITKEVGDINRSTLEEKIIDWYNSPKPLYIKEYQSNIEKFK